MESFEFSQELNEDELMSQEFEKKYGRSHIQKQLSYKVVGRLSRWEGGTDSPYINRPKIDTSDKEEAESMSIKEFLLQFFRPTYDLTEVTIEDIERVKIMHDRFLGDAQFNFNYTCMLIIASVIAGVGLGMNSTASIIASMLISPLMGPVTAVAYGIAINDYKMVRMAVVTEVSSLMICIFTGVIVALFFLLTPVSELDPNDPEDHPWPGSEMTSRGTMTNFWAGVPIAFFSGLGVAVGLLDSQTNSLVGVAISASLLPPAVNAGMLWIIHTQDEYDHMEYKWREYGTISLALTVMNIAVIIVASMFMFRLKETLPIEKSIFWSDLGVARKIYKNLAIIPNLQQAPSDEEIQKRVARFFPRCSEMARMRPSIVKNTRNLNISLSDDESESENQSESLSDFRATSAKGGLPRISE